MNNKKEAWLSILAGVWILACGAVDGSTGESNEVSDDLIYGSSTDALAGECTTTGQCKTLYGNDANDCKNSEGGVCYCGSSPCATGVTPPVDPPSSGAVTIPARIEAEDYVAFTDTTDAHSGDCGSGPVDIQKTTDSAGGTCNIGWTAAGETLDYKVSGSAGQYSIVLRLASAQSGKKVSLLVDGTSVGQVTVNGSGWQSFTDYTLSGISLSAGEHTLRVRFDDGNVNFNYLNITSSGTTPPPSTGSCEVKGEIKQWHRVEVLCDGPQSDENSDATFLNNRMNVTFSNGSTSMVIPGHFAADGGAANSGATAGKKWRAYFMPTKTGNWNYAVSFRSGSNIAISNNVNEGSAVSGIDGKSGSFSVAVSNKSGRDMRAHGLLTKKSNERLMAFAGSGQSYIEGGVDSPENLFGYVDFDNTTKQSNVGSCKGILHSFATHVADWKTGDPTWKNGKGKALIGEINYLASTGVNSMYLVPMSVNGDGCDAHPWNDYFGNRRRFDVSKLDQWEIAFSHMTKSGMLIHFVTQETENDQLLNGGALGNERKLYYREIISRFAHHPAIQWNMGEENTNTTAEQKSYADYISSVDAYGHSVLLHTYPDQHNIYDGLLGHSTFDGPTLQYGNIPESGTGGLYGEIQSWLSRSTQAGYPWLITATEASGGQAPLPNQSVSKTQRVYWMWASVMSGGGGFEWYLKNSGAGHAYDLAVENMREFDNFWKQSGYFVKFWNDIVPNDGVDVEQLTVNNALTSNANDWVLAKTGSAYIAFLRNGGSTQINLTGGGTYKVSWFNPRTGQLTNASNVSGSANQNLGSPPSGTTEDWVVFVRR